MKLFTESKVKYGGKGRVLRVKEGFNPNSSSCGSIVFSIHSAMAAVPVLLAGAAAWIAARMLSNRPSEENRAPKHETEAES